MHVDRAIVLRVGQPDEHVVAEGERRDDLLADERPVVRLRDRFDHGRRRPVRRTAVIVHPAAGRPFQRVFADGLAE